MPVYNADNPTEYSFSGKRIKRCSAAKGGFPHERLPVRQRGLYKTKQGKLINADANGAANIGVKSNLNGFIPDRRLGIFGYAIKGKI